MSTDTTHDIPSPEVRERADMYARYYRTIPDGDAIAGLCLRLASAEILDNRHSRMLAEATAERERLKAEVERLRAERAAMLCLIANLVDSDDCWFDHHGGCQAHGYLSLEPGEKCPQQEAKELIEASNVGEQR